VPGCRRGHDWPLAILLFLAGCQPLLRPFEVPLAGGSAVPHAHLGPGIAAFDAVTPRARGEQATFRAQPATAAVGVPPTPKYLSLRDAFLMAFERSETVRTLDSTSTVGRIGATTYDPLVLHERYLGEQARFDPTVSTGYVGSRINEPPDSFFGPGIPLNTRRDEGNFTASLSKPWATGATTTLAYNPPLGYLFFPNGTSGFNPAYSATTILETRQPLLKGMGLEVNTAPITIARLRRDQSELEVRQAMLAQVRGIEEAYWELQAAYASLQAIDAVLPLLDEAVRIEEVRLEGQLVTNAEVARSRLQRSGFLQQRVRAATRVANQQYRLGNLLGLSRHEAMNFVPMDPPLRARVEFDLEQATSTALHNRPDLQRQQLALRIRDLDLLVAANNARPRLDLQSLVRTQGLAEDLDDSLAQMLDLQFIDWTLGVNFSVPLGLRAGKAAQRSLQWEYARELALLRQNIENVGFQLAELGRDLELAWTEYTIVSERLVQAQEWLRIAALRFASPPPGGAGPNWLIVVLNEYQQALEAQVNAAADAAAAVARYNVTLSRIEEAQGTLLEKRQILLAEAAPAGGAVVGGPSVAADLGAKQSEPASPFQKSYRAAGHALPAAR